MGCICAECRDMCKNRPCWGTPEEINILLDNGFADRLWLDYWRCYPINIYIVGPAGIGYGGKEAPELPLVPCVFQDEVGLCDIHDIQKPFEGIMASCKPEEQIPDLHKNVAMTWDTDLGREVVRRWSSLVGFDIDAHFEDDSAEQIAYRAVWEIALKEEGLK